MRILIAVVSGAVCGVAYPLIDLLIACRRPVSEACVWGKAYLPFTFGLSIPIAGGIAAAIVYAALSGYGRTQPTEPRS